MKTAERSPTYNGSTGINGDNDRVLIGVVFEPCTTSIEGFRFYHYLKARPD
ncbi:MAG: hypothetical protein NTNFB02_34260 [Nitrospira sp.]